MIASLQSYLEQHQQSFLRDLAALVDVDCGTYNKPGVDAAGAVMAKLLHDTGFVVERIPLARYGDCLVGRITGRGRARVLLVGHLDTVYSDGTVAERPFRIEGDKAIGPGTCDMKGGLLAGVYAVRALRAAGYDDFAEIVFFCNSEEEVGSPESRHLYAPYAQKADAALVLEAARANGAIVSARKGSGTYTLRVTGRSSHAGVAPERGANAVVELAHHLLALTALNGLRPGLTLNAGVVAGGTRPNVVPDAAMAEFDFRVVRAEDYAALEAAVREIMATRHIDGTTTVLEGDLGMPPMELTPATAQLADTARMVAQELGFDIADIGPWGAGARWARADRPRGP
jgi:glutamate carboxypeptidase